MSELVADTRESEDKENLQHGALLSAKRSVHNISELPAVSDLASLQRTPLTSINGQKTIMMSGAKPLHLAQYSLVTPVSTPVHNGSSRHHKICSDTMGELMANLLQTGTDDSQDAGTPSKAVPLNALVYRKVVHIVDELKQEHDKQLNEKNAFIEQLQSQLESCTKISSQHDQDEEGTLRAKVVDFVDSIIKNAACQLATARSRSLSNTDFRSVATSPVTFPDQVSLDINDKVTSKNPLCSCAERKHSDSSAWLLQPLKLIYIEGKCLLDYSDSSMQINDTLMDGSDVECIENESAENNSGIIDESNLENLTPDQGRSYDGNMGISVTRNSDSYSSCNRTTTMPARSQKVNVMTVKIDPDTVTTSPVASNGGVLASTETPLTHKDVTSERVKVVNISTSPFLMKSQNDQLQDLKEDKTSLHVGTDGLMEKVTDLETQLARFCNVQELLPTIKQEQMELQQMLATGFEKMNQLINEQDKRKSLSHTNWQGRLQDKDDILANFQSEIKEQENIIAELRNINTAYKAEISVRDQQLFTCKDQMRKLDEKLADEKIKLKQFAELLEQKTLYLEQQECVWKTELELVKVSASQENERLKIDLKLMQTTSQEDNERIQELEEKHDELQKTSKQNYNRFELDISNLHCTLKNRDEDVAVIVQERDRMTKLVGHQKTVIRSMRQALEQSALIKSQLAVIQEEMSITKKSAEDSHKEKNILRDELAAKTMALTEMLKKDDLLVEENVTLKETLTKLMEKYNELMKDLDETKTRAHHLLLQQNAEITNSIVALHKLVSHLQHLHTEMVKYVQEELQSKNEGTLSRTEHSFSDQPPKSKHAAKKSRMSFICSILDSIKEPEKQEIPDIIHEEPGNIESDEEVKPPVTAGVNIIKPVIGAVNSAFVRVHPNSTEELTDGTQSAERGMAAEEEDGDKDGDEDEMEPLNVQVEEAYVVVDSIVELFQNLYALRKERDTEVQKQMKSVREQFEFEAEISSHHLKSSKAQVKSLNDEIKLACAREQLLHQELNEANDKIASKDKELKEAHDLILERTERMESLAENIQMSKRQDKELKKFAAMCKEKDTELSIMKHALDTTLGEMREKYGSTAASELRELIHFRKENAKLQEENSQVQTEKEVLYQKFARRMEVYKSNWEKADEEVARLDDLVERLRQALSQDMESVQGCSALRPILQELGVHDLSQTKMQIVADQPTSK